MNNMNNTNNTNTNNTNTNTNPTLSSLNKSPCMGCISREIGCHSNCETYNKWINIRTKVSNKIYNEKKKNSIIIGYEANKAYKITRRN